MCNFSLISETIVENFQRALRLYKCGDMIQKVAKCKLTYQFLPEMQDMLGCDFKTLMRILKIADASYNPIQPKQTAPPLHTWQELNEDQKLLEYAKYGYPKEIAKLILQTPTAVDWVFLLHIYRVCVGVGQLAKFYLFRSTY